MKRLFMLLLIAILPLAMVMSEAVKSGKTTVSFEDSIAGADTGTIDRTDADTTGSLDVTRFTKIGFVYSSVEDTNFTNDSTFFIWQYSADGAQWIQVDTMQVHLTSDTTYGIFYSLDSLPPMDYIRIIVVHRHKFASDEPGLEDNTYTTDAFVLLKGIK